METCLPRGTAAHCNSLTSSVNCASVDLYLPAATLPLFLVLIIFAFDRSSQAVIIFLQNLHLADFIVEECVN